MRLENQGPRGQSGFEDRRAWLWSMVTWGCLLALCGGLVGCEREAHWKRRPYPEGGFSVELPALPSRRTMRAESEYGPIEVEMISAELGKQHYAVIYWTYPKEAPQQVQVVFDAALLDTAANLSGKVERHFEADLGAVPGRGYVVSFGKDRLAVGRFYFARGRLVHIQVALPASEEAHPHVERFLRSFELPRGR